MAHGCQFDRIILRLSRIWWLQRIYPLECSHWIASVTRYKDLPRIPLTKLVRTILLLRSQSPAYATRYKKQTRRNDWTTETEKPRGIIRQQKSRDQRYTPKYEDADKIRSISYEGMWLDDILYTYYQILENEYTVYNIKYTKHRRTGYIRTLFTIMYLVLHSSLI